MKPNEHIMLSDAVRAIRRELEAAMIEGQRHNLRFGLGPIELELTVQVQTQLGGDAKLRVWVVEGGGSTARINSNTHKVKVTLNPIDSDGQPAKIAAKTDSDKW